VIKIFHPKRKEKKEKLIIIIEIHIKLNLILCHCTSHHREYFSNLRPGHFKITHSTTYNLKRLSELFAKHR
jgi:hypothetical protein